MLNDDLISSFLVYKIKDRTLKKIFVLLTLLIVSGCAHNVDISPKLAALYQEQPSKIDKIVGYYISDKNRTLSVTTPAGGGDSAKYTPYADLESGLNLVLSKVFTSAYKVKDISDQSFLRNKNIAWVFIPTITTTSSSRNYFFWPPTDFSVTINCVATDNDQQQIWNRTVQSDNDLIAVKEIIHDHGLAGRSAAANALKKLQAELLTAPEFRQ